MFNDNRSVLSINSQPAGADVLIEGRGYGRTPLKVDIKPGRYNVSLIREGYGTANFTTDYIQGIEKGPDGSRCLMDGIGSIFLVTFYSAFFSEKCTVFKEDYNIKIPFTASTYQTNDRINNSGSRKNSRANNMQVYQDYNNNNNSDNSNNSNSSSRESYDENDLFIRQGYGRSPRLPVYNINR